MLYKPEICVYIYNFFCFVGVNDEAILSIIFKHNFHKGTHLYAVYEQNRMWINGTNWAKLINIHVFNARLHKNIARTLRYNLKPALKANKKKTFCSPEPIIPGCMPVNSKLKLSNYIKSWEYGSAVVSIFNSKHSNWQSNQI